MNGVDGAHELPQAGAAAAARAHEANAAKARMSVAYLVNQYPKVSHSFIRREILALERVGVDVQRIAVRGWDAETPDVADALERSRTRYLLQGGPLPLIGATLRSLWRAPRPWIGAFALSLRLARQADRPWPYHLIYLMQACLLTEWLRASAASHLHAHFGTNPAEVALLARALGGPPFSFTVHGPEEFDKPTALHLGEKVGHAAFVVAISSFGRSQLYRWASHADWHRIAVVHCGLDASFLATEQASSTRSTRLVCVGRLCEQKGQLLLLEAVALLRARGIVLELVLAGDGEMRGVLEAVIARRGLGSCVRITGWISSEGVRDEMLAARALVLPSFAEGLPVVIMEAMALRRPVISTYVAGIPELVENGRTGWLVPAGDVAALATAIEACLAAPTEALHAMGQAANETVAQRHNVDREAAKLLTLFAMSASESAGGARG